MSYTPQYLSKKEFATYIAVVETFIQTNGNNAIRPVEVAERMDRLFNKVNHPQLEKLTQVFKALNAYSFWRKQKSFRKLTLKQRETIIVEIQNPGKFWRFIERIPGVTGASKDLIRGLKVLSTVGYYSHPLAKKQVGYIPFEERTSTQGIDLTPSIHNPKTS